MGQVRGAQGGIYWTLSCHSGSGYPRFEANNHKNGTLNVGKWDGAPQGKSSMAVLVFQMIARAHGPSQRGPGWHLLIYWTLSCHSGSGYPRFEANNHKNGTLSMANGMVHHKESHP